MKVNLTIRIPVWLDRIFVWPVVRYRRWKYGEAFRKIDLGEGEWTIVDEEDYYRYGKFKWFMQGNEGKFYAVSEFKIDSRRTTTLRLHREIMNAPAGLVVDHQNGNGLDNRRCNLRLANHSQNTHNSIRKTKDKTSSRYIGVSWDKYRRKWHARIQYMGKRINLGRFDSEEEAARAYDATARKLFGEFARLNFPEEAAVS
jgi:hypothetical protein